MRREMGRLTALAVTKAKAAGMHPDGGGLYLQVTESGAKSWIYRFTLHGRTREMGLGPLYTISLAMARAKADESRRMRLNGIDPIDARRGERIKAQLEAARAMTFKNAAAAFIRSHEAGWRNAKHVAQWKSTLAEYAEPVIGSLSVQAIDTGLVMRVLEPIWKTKTETAGRLRGRIETILDWAKVHGYRQGENPARWRGHLDKLLPQRSKVTRVEHHAALSYEEIGAFIAALRQRQDQGTAARGLEFTILTAARTGETIGATWREIDLKSKVWTISDNRMKAGREHRVPLSARVVEILEEIKPDQVKPDEYVFTGAKSGRPLSNMAFLMLLRRMKRDDLTTHGFRSTFRDWVAECTGFPAEVAEMALAHTLGDKVEAAYRRGDLFEKRRRLMEDWANHCEVTKPTGNVVPIKRGA
jgi:integrase